MINYKEITKTVTEKIPVSVTCDVCKKSWEERDVVLSEHGSHSETDIIESQEMHRFRWQGGYGSILGDMNILELDICQHCWKERLGEFIRDVTPVWDFEEETFEL
jgi:hypothetical protein